ncbi:MAG: Fe-S cluster assembly protein SufD [Alphaproteobacteria bacterium]|nr:Fe-S cluster assembly protein SufD [Alphaproteobacteria bacterium]
MTLAALLQRSREKREAWRYTDLAPLAAQNFVAANQDCKAGFPLPPPALWQRLVFVNGGYCPVLSDEKGLPEGFLKVEDDGHLTLSLAAQTCLASMPLELLFIATGEGAAQESSNILSLSLGTSARLTLIERHLCHGSAAKLHTMQTQITLADQAKLVHAKLVQGDAGYVQIASSLVEIAAGAFYDHFALVTGGRLVRCESEVVLRGPLADARLLAAMLLRGAAQADIVSTVWHNAPLGTSRQIVKSVLDGKARGVFQGKIYVAKGAQKTDGYQLCRALLLSAQAEMDAKPELEIYADDVKCSHGTAIGDLDEEALFYLRSRGIGEQEARALLVGAFIGELVDQVQSAEIADLVRKEVTAWLG